jgi:hypothetical protein
MSGRINGSESRTWVVQRRASSKRSRSKKGSFATDHGIISDAPVVMRLQACPGLPGSCVHGALALIDGLISLLRPRL